MKPGAVVRMTEAHKASLAVHASDHVAEFGDCVGVVLGQAEGDWPEVDVRWQPSGLRYAYRVEDLEEV